MCFSPPVVLVRVRFRLMLLLRWSSDVSLAVNFGDNINEDQSEIIADDSILTVEFVANQSYFYDAISTSTVRSYRTHCPLLR